MDDTRGQRQSRISTRSLARLTSDCQLAHCGHDAAVSRRRSDSCNPGSSSASRQPGPNHRIRPKVKRQSRHQSLEHALKYIRVHCTTTTTTQFFSSPGLSAVQAFDSPAALRMPGTRRSLSLRDLFIHTRHHHTPLFRGRLPSLSLLSLPTLPVILPPSTGATTVYDTLPCPLSSHT